MNSRKREVMMMGLGILTGIALSGSVAEAAANLTATPSTQTFYLGGQQISLEAYSIHGNNFVKLRDIGQTVDFGVTYNAATNSVYINPGAHYQADTSGQAGNITEEGAYAALMALKAQYPHGTPYGSPYQPIVRMYANSDKCAGWAMKCSDAVFGTLPYRSIENPSWDQIRVGDILDYRTERSGHGVVVVKKTDDYVEVTESGGHNEARWGGQYFRWWLEAQPGYTLRTRYPE